MTKEQIIKVMESIFENTKRIHGNSESIDWVKVAIHKSAGYLENKLLSLAKEEQPTDEDIYKYIRDERDKLLHGKGNMSIGRITLGELEWLQLCLDISKAMRDGLITKTK